MEILALAAYFLAVYWYSSRTDGAAARLTGLAADGAPLAGWRIVRARSFANRRIGLLNHAGLPERTGLLLGKSRAVHTKGMLFPIDLVFLDETGRVLGSRAAVAPGERRVAGPRKTRMVLELPAGTLGASLPADVQALSFPELTPAEPTAPPVHAAASQG